MQIELSQEDEEAVIAMLTMLNAKEYPTAQSVMEDPEMLDMRIDVLRRLQAYCTEDIKLHDVLVHIVKTY